MKIVYNRFIPFKGFSAFTFLGMIFTRKSELPLVTINHEKIHIYQERELAYFLFWVLYLLEWLVKSILYFNFYTGYKNISFEREAYSNEENLNYLTIRKPYNWVKLIWRKKNQSTKM